MPKKAKRPCGHVGCSHYSLEGSSRCELHRNEVKYGRKKPRPSYLWNSDAQWKKIRIQVLSDNDIPESEWKNYVIDHRPPYDPTIEPDHRNYTLVPMTRSEHSKKTNRYDGGWGNKKRIPH